MNGIKARVKYPPEVREFCLGLQYRSSSAYEFVRKTFENNLPSLSTLRAWYSASDMNAEPGIHKKCIDILAQKAAQFNEQGKKLIVTLMFDEMHIRKHLQYCHSSKQILGLVSYGNDSLEPEMANQVIVFLVNGLNCRLQIPISYHFISKLNKNSRKSLLVDVITELHKANVDISNITFDGHPSNRPMCEELGANLNVYSPLFRPYIEMNSKKIFIILDPCHMLKLARNTLGNKKTLIDPNGNKIEWHYFEELVRFSKEKDFGLCHKMNDKHLQWKRQEMKVDLAVQTLSQSVADSIKFLMEEGYTEFSRSSATINYVKLFNNLFDVFNTKPDKDNENPFKRAIRADNKEDISSLFSSAIDYLKKLKVIESNGKSVLVCKSKSKTAFIGFIIDMTSLLLMYEDYVENQSLMRSIPTHPILQDHVELFFCMCRSQNGFNDNPTVQQFKSAYRKLLVNNTKINISKGANCQLFETDSKPFSNILTVSSRHSIQEQIDLDGNEPTDNETRELLQMLSEIESVEKNGLIDSSLLKLSIVHIANMIEFKIKNEGCWYCSECKDVFSENIKLRGRSISSKFKEQPCSDTYNICKEVDRFLHLKFLTGQIKYATIHYTIMRNICLETLFCKTDFRHSFNHKLYLIRTIIDCYIQIRCTYLVKCSTLNSQDKFLRSKFRSLLHFRGQ